MQPWTAVYDNIHYTRYMRLQLGYNEQCKRKMSVIREKCTVFNSFIWTSILAIYVEQWIEVTSNKGSTIKAGYIEIKSWLIFMQRQPTKSAK